MSGSTIGGIAGAGIGLVVGGPAGLKWGAWIGSTVGSLVAPGTIEGPKIGDAQTQTSQAGMPRPIVFGHPAPFAGNLIDGETKARKVTRKSKQGKGGPTVKTTVFLLTSAIRVGEPIGGYVRIWEDDVVVYDARTTFPAGWEGYSQEIRVKQAKWLQKARLYLGTESQLPDPALEAIHGVGNTPYFRGTAYITVEDAESQDGTVKRYRFEVAAAGTASTSADYLESLGPAFDYRFDGNGEDSTGNLLDLVPGGTASIGADEITFIHSVDYASVTEGPGIDNSTNVTILCKCRLDLLSGGSVSKDIAAHVTNSIFGFGNWWMKLSGPNRLSPEIQWRNSGGSGTTITAGFEVGLSDEFVFGFRKSSAGVLDLVFDGEAVVTDAVGAGGTVNGSGTFVVGGGRFFPSSGGFIGAVGRLIGFKYALTDAQLRNASISLGLGDAVPIPDSGGSVWDLLQRVMVATTDVHTMFTADAGVDLDYVEAQICARCNIPAGKLNFSALAGITIPGFLVTDQPTGADTLLPLLQANFHDLPEVDGQLLARLRGGAVVMSFTDDDLIDIGEDEEVVRPQEIEFPLKVSVVTQDPDADYAPIPQSSLRYSPSVSAASEVTLQVPIPYHADEAAQIAHKLHKIAWSNAEARIERVLPQEFALLVPSDPVSYDNRRWLVIEREYTDGEVRIRAVYERASDVSSTVTGQAVPVPTPPTGTILGPTVFQAMNLPTLRPEDNVSGVYLAAMGVFDGWTGADIYLSINGGPETLVKEITQASVMGELVDNEPSGGEPLTVRLYDADDTLDNATAAEVAAGQNAVAIIDASDNAEIIGYENATETSAGDWEIDILTRGTLDTTEASHSMGERFVALDYVYFLPIDASLAGSMLTFRAVTKGTIVDANPTVDLVFDPPTFVLDGGGA